MLETPKQFPADDDDIEAEDDDFEGEEICNCWSDGKPNPECKVCEGTGTFIRE